LTHSVNLAFDLNGASKINVGFGPGSDFKMRPIYNSDQNYGDDCAKRKSIVSLFTASCKQCVLVCDVDTWLIDLLFHVTETVNRSNTNWINRLTDVG